jgi:hypothetical protein
MHDEDSLQNRCAHAVATIGPVHHAIYGIQQSDRSSEPDFVAQGCQVRIQCPIDKQRTEIVNVGSIFVTKLRVHRRRRGWCSSGGRGGNITTIATVVITI